MIAVVLRKFLGAVMRLGNDTTDGSDKANALLTFFFFGPINH